MPFFMRGEGLEPLIRVQASQKRMRHPVFTDRTHVADRFASRLTPFFGWPRFPSVRRDGICGAQKFALGASKVLDHGRK